MNRPAGIGEKPRAAERMARSDDEGAENAPSLRRFGGSMLCAVLVLLAVGLESASGQAANSPEDAQYANVVPLGWPRPVRVLWWVFIAAAAAGHRLLLAERRGVRRHMFAALAATPFALFAVGIAVGASWSTWH